MNDTITLPLIQQFLTYLTEERHFSPYTGRCYGLDLRQFVDFIESKIGLKVDMDKERRAAESKTGGTDTVTGRILRCEVDLIREFLSKLGEQKYSAATMARKIATLRSFHKWMERKGIAATNPMVLIRTPKQAKRLPKAISVEQIERLLSAPDDSEILGARDRAIPVRFVAADVASRFLVQHGAGRTHAQRATGEVELVVREIELALVVT